MSLCKIVGSYLKMLALNVRRRRHLIDNPKQTLAVKPPTISKLKLFIRYFSGMPEQSDGCDPNVYKSFLYYLHLVIE